MVEADNKAAVSGEDEEMVDLDDIQVKTQEALDPYPQSLLLIIKAAQNQNGLRHSDYGRYHRYCCRRMLRLRKSLGHTQHSRKQNKKQIFVEKPVTTDLALTSPKFL